ncbi:MAG: flagellar export chaperone FliS [Planctomycetes bacterium]|nr:flagellar export chaperone FliS [Planctomycetota bacterium]
MTTSVDNPYLRDAVMTATPEQLQLMLYDGAIRFATQGKEALLAKNYEQSYEKLTRAQSIITEMLAGLNYEVNRELCRRVASIYQFLHRRLVDANARRDPQAVDDALRVLRVERETWEILCDKVARARDAGSAGMPSADPPSAGATEFSAEA